MLDIRTKVEGTAPLKKEKVVILLHGVTGSCEDPFMQDLSGACAENGCNVIVFNHFAPNGEKDCRLMDMAHNKHMDEVVLYARQRFGSEEKPCDIILAGFSLGGNHILRYLGRAAIDRNQVELAREVPDQTEFVKAAVAISMPFCIFTTSMKLKNTYFGVFDKIIANWLHEAFRHGRFKN